MPSGDRWFNFGKIKHPAKWNHSYFPFYDYSDRYDGMTMQPRPSVTKILSANLSETASNDALSHGFPPPTEVLQTSNKASMIAVLIIMAVFLIITISTTSLLLAFCRKKNTVFAAQKCDEQDSEYELDDIEQTDIEMLKEEAGTTRSPASRSHTCPSFTEISRDIKDSPTNQPLMCNDSARLPVRKHKRKNNASRIPKSKTFTCSVYYNANRDHQTAVYSNILQTDSLYDGCSSRKKRVYHGEFSESSIVKSSSCADIKTIVPKCKTANEDYDLESSTLLNANSNENRSVEKFTPKQDLFFTLYNKNSNESRKEVLNVNISKQDNVLGSSILHKTSCCTNAADVRLQDQREATLYDTRCATTYANDNLTAVCEHKVVGNLEDAILVDVCSGECTTSYDRAMKLDMFVKPR